MEIRILEKAVRVDERGDGAGYHVGEREAHHGALGDHRRQRLGDVEGVEVWPRLVKRHDG